MVQAIQANNFNVVATTHKSCCRQITNAMAKAWKAFMHALHAFLQPLYRCWHNQCKVKNQLYSYNNIFKSLQNRARALPADQLARGFLFEVKDHAGISRGHIFGTIHSLHKNYHYWHESIFDAFRGSTHLGVEQLTFDYDLGQGMNRSLQGGANEFFADPALDQNAIAYAADQLKLASIQLGNVTPDQIAEHDRAVQREIRDLPDNEKIKKKNRMNFLFYYYNYRIMIVPAANRQDYLPGADSRLTAAAMQENKPILGLESEFTRNQYLKLTQIESYRILLGKNTEELIAQRANIHLFIRRSEELWKSGDLEAFARHMTARDADRLQRLRDPVLFQQMETINRERNMQMAETIDRFVRGPGKLMGVFGCAHLVGQDNVLDLVRRRGWTIEQVGVAPPIPIAAVG